MLTVSRTRTISRVLSRTVLCCPILCRVLCMGVTSIAGSASSCYIHSSSYDSISCSAGLSSSGLQMLPDRTAGDTSYQSRIGGTFNTDFPMLSQP